jgi:ribosome-associated protein
VLARFSDFLVVDQASDAGIKPLEVEISMGFAPAFEEMGLATRRGKQVPSINFDLRGECIALCDLLKCAGIAGSSGAGKHLVALGRVRVDGQPEGRKTAKIRPGQVIDCEGTRITVTAALAGREADQKEER